MKLIKKTGQKCPEIVTKIKFLVDEGSFKYVMSGSLLGVELKGIASVPVGYLTVLKMYPMDFEEFMIANGVSNTTLDMLIEKFVTCSSMDELPVYWIFIMIAVAVALSSDVIDTKADANGKLKKVIVTFCVGIVVVLSIVIKIAL